MKTHKPTKMKLLAVSVISTLAMMANTAYADVEKKLIGDLEIYAKPSGSNEASLLLMLDFSGSMWLAPDPKGVITNKNVFAIPLQDGVPKAKILQTGYSNYEWRNKGVDPNAPDSEKRKLSGSSEVLKCDWGYKDYYDEPNDIYKKYIYKKEGNNFFYWNEAEQTWKPSGNKAEEYEKQGTQNVGGQNVTVYYRAKEMWRGNYEYFCEKEYSAIDKCKEGYGDDIFTFAENKSYTYTDPIDSSKSFTVTLPTNSDETIGTSANGKTLFGNQLYGLSGCQITDDPETKHYNRVSILKHSLLTLLTTPGEIPDNIRFGLGVYSELAGEDNPIQRGGHTGTILAPVAPLTFEHRRLLADTIAKLVPSSGTPLPTAYAEAGASMLGTSSYNNPDNASAVQRYTVKGAIGYDGSSADTKLTDGTKKYKRGGNASECGANGIYLMTDGQPQIATIFPHSSGGKSSSTDSVHGWYDYKGNNFDNISTVARYFMNNSLNNDSKYSIANCAGSGLVSQSRAAQEYGGWECMGAYAKRLREGKTPNNTKILTATAGFGRLFEGITKTSSIDPVTQEKSVDYACDSGDINADNLCKLGEEQQGYGEGGFTHVMTSEDISKSITTFIKKLNNALPTKPSGTIVIPDDPFSTKGQQPIAYLPIIDAKPANNVATWPGNLKKYGIKEGTLIGKGSANLFDNSKGEGSFKDSTQDYWSDKDYTGTDGNGNAITNSSVHSGGIYAHLSTPKSGLASVRTVFVEDDGKLKKFSVNSSGKIEVDGQALTAGSFVDTALYDGKMIGNLLQFLGFNSGKKNGEASKDIDSNGIADIAGYVGYTLDKPTQAVRVLGASPHSAPVTLSYGVDLDNLGKIVDSTRKDYVLFGSMDGALHLVDTKNENSTNNSKETFAVLTKAMLKNQPDALMPSASGTAEGVPYFGADAPWLIAEDFDYDLDTQKATLEGEVMAYGGFRMGAEGLYALNLTNKSKPEIAFSLNDKVSGFERLGQVWNKPRLAKIKQSNSEDDEGIDVLIFGGGYDTCYEDENYQVGTTTSTLKNQRGQACNRTSDKNAIGNAVYIVNAKDGTLIWSTDQLNGADKANIKHSVVADVVTLDRDNDGFMDHLYFADLGGQVFRVDFTNGGTYIYSGTEQTEASGFGVQNFVRLYHDDTSDKQFVRRFYNKPVISMQRSTQPDANGSRFNNGYLYALINVASGDRSSPLSKLRKTTANADRIYGIFDTDVTKPNKKLYEDGFTPDVADLTNTNLVDLPQAMGGFPVSTDKKSEAVAEVKNNNGWYYPLTRFDGYNNVMFNKAVGKYAVIDNRLYMTVYNPNMRYDKASAKESCQATIKGASERELYCLPYGICANEKSTNGTGGFARAGIGIQELTLGPRGSSKEHRKQRVLIGTRTLKDRENDRIDFGEGTTGSAVADPSKNGGKEDPTETGGGGSMGEFIATEGYVLESKTWYDSNVNDD